MRTFIQDTLVAIMMGVSIHFHQYGVAAALSTWVVCSKLQGIIKATGGGH